MRGGEKFWLKIEVHGGNGVCMWFGHQNYMGASFQAPRHTQTMTNGNTPCSLINFMFQYISSTRSYRLTYIHGEQYNIMVYNNNKNKNNNNNNINNNNNMHKMMSITNSEPYGSTGACNKHSKFFLKGECCKLRVKCSTFSPEGRICNIMY